MQTGWNAIRKPLVISVRPLHVQIETNNSCNCNCQTCLRSEIIKNPENISFENFKKIIDVTDPVFVTICGFGETLLHPEAEKMFAYMKNKGISVNFTSNAVLLVKNYKWIADLGIDTLSISLDAANPDSYKKIRGVDAFPQIIEGIKSLQGYKKERGLSLPGTRIQMVIQQDNINELEDFVRLAKSLEIDAAYFQVMNMMGLDNRRDNLASALTPDLVKEKIMAAREAAKSLGVATNLDVILKKFEQYYHKENVKKFYPCFYPWYTLMVNLDGNVQPCCSFGGPNSGVYFGNIYQEDFTRMFNNDKFQNFRRLLKRGERPYECCKLCVPLTLTEVFGVDKFVPKFYKK